MNNEWFFQGCQKTLPEENSIRAVSDSQRGLPYLLRSMRPKSLPAADSYRRPKPRWTNG
jgi:hypothetical protein